MHLKKQSIGQAEQTAREKRENYEFLSRLSC